MSSRLVLSCLASVLVLLACLICTMFVCLTIEGLSCGCFADVDGPESDIGDSTCSDLESLGDGLSVSSASGLCGA